VWLERCSKEIWAFDAKGVLRGKIQPEYSNAQGIHLMFPENKVLSDNTVVKVNIEEVFHKKKSAATPTAANTSDKEES
jgi:hypothetical protein